MLIEHLLKLDLLTSCLYILILNNINMMNIRYSLHFILRCLNLALLSTLLSQAPLSGYWLACCVALYKDSTSCPLRSTLGKTIFRKNYIPEDRPRSVLMRIDAEYLIDLEDELQTFHEDVLDVTKCKKIEEVSE